VSWLPSAEAEDLRGHLRKFLGQNAGRTQLRAQLGADSGYDAALWHRCVGELGLTGLATPEAVGGSDADLLTLGVVFEEFGRALVCAPLLATAGLATQALLRACAPDVAAPVLEAITGGAVATLGWDGERPSQSGILAHGDTVTGTAALVLDGADADVLLISARSAGGVALHLVDPAAAGVARVPLTTLDTTRRIARVELTDAPAVQLAADCAPALDNALDVTTLLLCAEQVGGARRALEMAVDHAKTRIQFSRPIGSFQAIKHRCADMLVDVELAASLVGHALHAVDTDLRVAALEASLARGFVADAFVTVAGANIQIHGGIGFTWEHDAHLYLKRAKASQVLFGSPGAHRRRAADLLGITA
jgi:alkylation response protein AidB-like acyl-CoA dehydrogenase